ncbi:MAG: hypothetical protein MHM6MM_000321 [Cercozoa sp. M6MM]
MMMQARPCRAVARWGHLRHLSTTSNNASLGELEESLSQARQRLEFLEARLDVPKLRERLVELEEKMGDSSFWESDNDVVQGTMKRHGALRKRLADLDALRHAAEDAEESLELLRMEDSSDPDILADVQESLREADATAEELELKLHMNHKFAENGCFMHFNPGAGGVASRGWAEQLLRMYERFATRFGFSCSVLDETPHAEGGISGATLRIDGDNAYGWLRHEHGVHRAIVQNPKRQTLFTGIKVTPEVAEADTDFVIPKKDLKIETMRAGGAGGQHVNVTDSAVRITHIPSGIQAKSQSSRSQDANRSEAMKMLYSRVAALMEEQRQQEVQSSLRELDAVEFGSQIRTFIMDAGVVVDHRTKFEQRPPEKLLDRGELDDMLRYNLVHLAEEEQKQQQEQQQKPAPE